MVELGLERATDREIWEYAAENDFVIISKDSDFRQMAIAYGPPPKSIWLNIGNSSSTIILELLSTNQNEIARFSEGREESFMMLAADSLDKQPEIGSPRLSAGRTATR